MMELVFEISITETKMCVINNMLFDIKKYDEKKEILSGIRFKK